MSDLGGEEFCVSFSMQAFGKARPRVTRHGTYMPKAYTAKINELRFFVGALPSWCYAGEPVFLHVRAFFAMPKSWSKAKKLEHLGQLKPSTPDGDNMVGAVMDALWPKDAGGDSHVFLNGERRYWAELNYMEIIIRSKENE